MATKKKNDLSFNKKQVKDKLLIEIGGKQYKIRNNEYFVNMALKRLGQIEEAEGLESLDLVFDALAYLYGRDVLEEIAENNEDIDWAEFIKFSVAMASGMTKEQYDEQLEEDAKNA